MGDLSDLGINFANVAPTFTKYLSNPLDITFWSDVFTLFTWKIVLIVELRLLLIPFLITSHVLRIFDFCFHNCSLKYSFSPMRSKWFNLFLYCLYLCIISGLAFLCWDLIYSLFLVFIDSFKAGVSHVFFIMVRTFESFFGKRGVVCL